MHHFDKMLHYNIHRSIGQVESFSGEANLEKRLFVNLFTILNELEFTEE